MLNSEKFISKDSMKLKKLAINSCFWKRKRLKIKWSHDDKSLKWLMKTHTNENSICLIWLKSFKMEVLSLRMGTEWWRNKIRFWKLRLKTMLRFESSCLITLSRFLKRTEIWFKNEKLNDKSCDRLTLMLSRFKSSFDLSWQLLEADSLSHQRNSDETWPSSIKWSQKTI